jgi:hypothetical protein
MKLLNRLLADNLRATDKLKDTNTLDSGHLLTPEKNLCVFTSM